MEMRVKRGIAKALAGLVFFVGIGPLIPPAYANHDGSECRIYIDEDGNYYVSTTAHTLQECQDQGFATGPNGYQWTPATPGTTTAPTTTTIPPSTTTSTTQPPPPTGQCTRNSDGSSGAFCIDAVNAGSEVDISSCNTPGPQYCSAIYVERDDGAIPLGFAHHEVNEWRLTRSGSAVYPVSSRWLLQQPDPFPTSISSAHLEGQRVPHSTTGKICIARTDGSYMAIEIAIPAPSPLNLGTNLSYMWRPTNVYVGNHEYGNGWQSTPPPSGFYPDPQQSCGTNDPTILTNNKPEVRTPAIDCYREFTDFGVRVRAIVGNPNDGATDTVSIVLEGDDTQITQLFPGGQHGDIAHEFAMPVGEMPPDGWRATCTVKRVVNVQTHRGSSGWMAGANITNDVPVTNIPKYPRGNQGFFCGSQDNWLTGKTFNPCPDVNEGIIAGAGGAVTMPPPSQIPTLVPPGEPLPLYTVKVPPIIPPPGVAPIVPIGANVPTIVGIPAAGYTGWNLGGGLLGLGAELGLWQGDDEWFCQWNPGYKLARANYCQEILANRPYLRNEIYLEDQFKHPIPTTGVSSYDWVVGTAVAQVLVNPLKQNTGTRTTTSVETEPNPDPQRQAATQVATDPDTGTARAVAQDPSLDPSPDPNPEPCTVACDPTADPRPPPTTPDPSLPPPVIPDVPHGEGDCSLSFWEFLNPFNIASTIACFLKLLFIPTDWNKIKSLWGDLTSRVPFSYLKQVVLFLPSLVTDISSSASSTSCANILPHGLNDLPGEHGPISITDKMGCPQSSDSVLYPARGFLGIMRMVVFLIFVMSMAFGVYHLITWAIT